MLNRYDRAAPINGEAEVKYLDGDFRVVKPGAFGDRDLFGAYMSAWTRTYLDAGAGKGKLPGRRGARLEQEGRERGIELSDAIAKELTALGGRLGIPFSI